LIDEQGVAGDLPDPLQDSVPVQRSERDGAQDEEVERTGENLGVVSHASS
jgi:hypothetical protein